MNNGIRIMATIHQNRFAFARLQKDYPKSNTETRMKFQIKTNATV